jgi:hypothetical protein
VSVKQRIEQACLREDLVTICAVITEKPTALRHLASLTYHADDTVRTSAIRGVAQVAQHLPKKVQEMARRLVWAMNDESGTNAQTAPEVLQAIAEAKPELLLPMVPDLLRLAAEDKTLRPGLAATLKKVARGCPGEVGARLGKDLTRVCEGRCDPEADD